ncbi:MAG: NAD-dependent epimerase/dehydratase family protein [Calditrichaeota bacterium]|nr:NAD-dependent epimerase/dehydratase family protein [Calditrichota bacterium]
MQTILGSGGGIGIPLAKELKNYTDQIRLVSRNPHKINDSDELLSADFHDLDKIDAAITGSEVVYVLAGFEYKLSVWQQQWPAFMQAVIDACKKHGSKLVFFDNMYLYADAAVPHMTEDSPIDPSSKKGAVRKQLHEMIFEEVDKKKLTALIARSADFYGPDNKNSALSLMVAENLLKGKKAQALGNIDKIHTYTYTPDAAKATAMLGNTDDAFNQVWHVPTTKEKLTNRQWIQMIADELKVEPKIQIAPKWLLHILGVFIPIMKEFPEMLYQYENDYYFDSSKFEKRFKFKVTTPADGIRELVKNLKAE